MAEAPAGVIAQLVHDLRSPLAAVELYAAVLERDTGELSSEQRTDYAQRIRKAAADMRVLLDAV